jgi:hypothetical protein
MPSSCGRRDHHVDLLSSRPWLNEAMPTTGSGERSGDGFTVLATDRLVIRALRTEDAPAFAAYGSVGSRPQLLSGATG